MPNSPNLCEYYFDSKVERVSGDKDIKEPKLYFERDLEKKGLEHRLFAVVQEWLPQNGNENKYVEDKYDTVKIYYSQNTTDCATVCADVENLKEFKQEDVGPEKTGNVLEFKTGNSFNPSGVGCIEMLKNGKSVARFYFAINCAYRKKIVYSINKSDKGASIIFECKNPPSQTVRVILLGDERRLPCLVEDRKKENAIPIDLQFEGFPRKIVKVDLDPEIYNAPDHKLFLVLDKAFEDAFVLVSKYNYTLPEAKRPQPLQPSYTCPFCHGPIAVRLERTKAYKKGGGVACNATEKDATSIGIKDENRRVKKQCLVCAEDVPYITGVKSDRYAHKILPDNFLGHNHFKVAFAGAPRSGKTTYLSRFFGLSTKLVGANDYKFHINMTEMKNAAARFGIRLTPAIIRAVGRDQILSGTWPEKEKEYVDRGMQIGRPLPSTEPKDYTAFPFTVEVNDNNYVSFYDIAGESTTGLDSSQIKKLAENDTQGRKKEQTIGIFFVVTATNNEGASINAKVANYLQSAGEQLSTKCPIAIILTKMDDEEVGVKFDSSCACRRFDFYPPTKNFIYDGSDVEKFINDSSEEIKSFIEHEGGSVDVERQADGKATDTKRFDNVKYFCMSSFGFADSTYHIDKPKDEKSKKDSKKDRESYMLYKSSMRRMELPFIWMMRQFGIID